MSGTHLTGSREALLKLAVCALGFAMSIPIATPTGLKFHAQLTHGDGVVYVGPAMPQLGTARASHTETSCCTVHLRVADLDAHHANADAHVDAAIKAAPAVHPPVQA